MEGTEYYLLTVRSVEWAARLLVILIAEAQTPVTIMLFGCWIWPQRALVKSCLTIHGIKRSKGDEVGLCAWIRLALIHRLNTNNHKLTLFPVQNLESLKKSFRRNLRSVPSLFVQSRDNAFSLPKWVHLVWDFFVKLERIGIAQWWRPANIATRWPHIATAISLNRYTYSYAEIVPSRMNDNWETSVYGIVRSIGWVWR